MDFKHRHFSLCVLPILILFPGLVFSTPSKLTDVEERFIGSNKKGSTYFTLTEVSEYYEEGWGWSYIKKSWSIQEFRNAGGDKFTKIERPLMSLEESSDMSEFEIAGNSALKMDDLLTSSTAVSFDIVEQGLKARSSHKAALILTMDKLRELMGVQYLGWIEPYVGAYRSEDFFFLSISYRTYGTRTAVLPISARIVEQALEKAAPGDVMELHKKQDFSKRAIWDNPPQDKEKSGFGVERFDYSLVSPKPSSAPLRK